jgi:hypothetical protein
MLRGNPSDQNYRSSCLVAVPTAQAHCEIIDIFVKTDPEVV